MKTKEVTTKPNISKEKIKKVINCVVVAILVIAYFLILQLAATKMQKERLIEDIKVFSGAFLVFGIILIEQAYKRDDGYKAIDGIEMLVLSAYTLSIMHIITKYGYELRTYIWYSLYIVIIYYIIKATIVYTAGNKKYLDGFNDIAEIINDEPQKKEAKRKKTVNTKTTKKRKKSNAPRTKAVYKEKKLTNATNKKQNKTTKKGKRMTATSSRKLGNNNNKNGKRVK